MDYFCKLEQFRLRELKEIFNTFQKKYGLLSFFKIYTLNKYDLICLLRNSKCFDETYSNHILFKLNDINIKLKPEPKKTIYRGEKVTKLTYIRKSVYISF